MANENPVRLVNWTPTDYACLGAAALIEEERWILAFLGLLGTIVALLIWDVRRAGGLAAWITALVPAAVEWDKFMDSRKARRDLRRTRHLRERRKRRRIKQGHRRRTIHGQRRRD